MFTSASPSDMESIFRNADDLLSTPAPNHQPPDEIQPKRPVETVKLELTELPRENDSLSDDTHFDQAQARSNDSSKHPSPTKQMNFKTALSNVNVDHIIPTPNLIHTYQPKAPLPRCEDACEEGTVPKGSQLDIAEFIDSFLETDKLLNAIPGVDESVKQEPSEVPIADSCAKHVAQDAGLRQGEPVSSVPDASDDSLPKTYSEQLNPRTGNNIQREPGVSFLPRGASITAATIRKSEKRKPRTYSQAVPSQHCHICSRRPTEGSPHQICGNLSKGRCRKTICTKCFHQFRWDLKAAREAPPGTWECPHCRGECPQRAQCVIYNRTSDRRRLKLINHRKRKSAPQESKPTAGTAARKRQALEKSDSPDSGRTAMPSVPLLKRRCEKASSGPSLSHSDLQSKSRERMGDLMLKHTPKDRLKGIQKDEKSKEDQACSREAHVPTYPNASAIASEQGRIIHPAGRPSLESQAADPQSLLWQSDLPGSHTNSAMNQYLNPNQPDIQLLPREVSSLGLFTSPQRIQQTDMKEENIQSGAGVEHGSGDIEAKNESLLGQFTICIEDLLPGTNSQLQLQDDFAVPETQDAAENLWVLNVSGQDSSTNNVKDSVATPFDQDKENILNQIQLDEIDGNSLSQDRSEHQDSQLFNEF